MFLPEAQPVFCHLERLKEEVLGGDKIPSSSLHVPNRLNLPDTEQARWQWVKQGNGLGFVEILSFIAQQSRRAHMPDF